MVYDRADALDVLFGALADPTRRAMIARLAEGTVPIGELSRPFEMSFAAASKHVRVLERAGLLRREIRGRQHYCSLDAAPLARAAEWVDRYARFWSQRFDELERMIDGDSSGR